MEGGPGMLQAARPYNCCETSDPAFVLRFPFDAVAVPRFPQFAVTGIG